MEVGGDDMSEDKVPDEPASGNPQEESEAHEAGADGRPGWVQSVIEKSKRSKQS